MGKRLPWLLGALALTSAGCQQQDIDRLARLGTKVSQRAEDLVVGGSGRVMRGWNAVRLHWGQMAVDARVAARLSWDKDLEGTQLQVEADGGVVKLKGKLADAAKRRRAVELASSTSGVEKVIDELE